MLYNLRDTTHVEADFLSRMFSGPVPPGRERNVQLPTHLVECGIRDAISLGDGGNRFGPYFVVEGFAVICLDGIHNNFSTRRCYG